MNVEGAKMSQLRGRGGVLLCRPEKQVLVAVRRGEAVLERIRNKRNVSEVLLLYLFASSQDSYANKPFGTIRGEAPGLWASHHKDFLAVLRATPRGTGASQQGWQGLQVGERVCEFFCSPSVFPDSWRVEP